MVGTLVRGKSKNRSNAQYRNWVKRHDKSMVFETRIPVFFLLTSPA